MRLRHSLLMLSLASSSVLAEEKAPGKAPAPVESNIPVKPDSTLTVRAKQKKRFVIGPMERVALGSSAVADIANAGGDALIVQGISPGETTLDVWLRSGKRASFTIEVTK